MPHASQTVPEDLEQAFRAFTDISRALTDSYAHLEQRVSGLAVELAEARNGELEQLREKERLAGRLERLLEALPAGVVVLGGDGRVQEHNPAAAVLLEGLERGALWRDVVARCFAPRPDDGQDVSLASGRLVSLSTCSMGAEPGQIVLLHDVTENRALQDQLRRAERLSEMGRMFAALAHQIRTPLATALLHASNLGRGAEGNAATGRAGERIRERLRHLERLVDEMLVFARQGSFSVEVLDAAALLESFAASLPAGVARVDQAPQAAGSRVQGNREALESALQNLVNNALQAGGEATAIELRLHRSGSDRVRIEVADDGPGMPAESSARAFEPFFTTRNDGTGLGLAIVRGIVESHGGEVRLDSQPGGGTTVMIELPLWGGQMNSKHGESS